MRQIDSTDARGLQRRIELPDDASDDEINAGILVGPPDLSPLDLPPDLEVRLNAELWNRGLFTYADVLRKRNELLAAWQAVLRVDVTRLMALYAGSNGYH